MYNDDPQFRVQRHLWWMGGGPPPPAPSWETFLFHARLGTNSLPECGFYSPPTHLPFPQHLIANGANDDGPATPSPPPITPPPLSHPPLPLAPPMQLEAGPLQRQGPQNVANEPPVPQHHVSTPVPPTPVPEVGLHGLGRPAAVAGPVAPPPPALPEVPSVLLQILVPRAGILHTISVDSNITPSDFRNKICIEADIRPETARLGYKLPREAKSAPPHSLETDEDARRVIADMVTLVQRARSQVPVLTIVSLAPPPPVVQPAKNPRPNETPESKGGDPMLDEKKLGILRKLKANHTCAKHPGQHRWCLVRPDGEHIFLTLQFLVYWAQKIVNEEATYKHPPNNHSFDLKKRTRTADEKKVSASSQPTIIIQNMPLGDATNSPSKKRKRAAKADDDSSESDSDDEEYADIATVLDSLDAKYPALKLPQYLEKLSGQGISYVNIANNFPQAFYTETIGMAAGAVPIFLKGCDCAVRKAKKARRVGKHVARNSGDEN
ncbi:hypothetical protein FRC05_003583 [Tulasnella sp. 425]|nr:hypothetical protein FRC05_003583 [Tulasnella sp. 425]